MKNLVILMILSTIICLDRRAEFNPFPANRGTIYEYTEDDVDTMEYLFFPTEKSRWDGYDVTNKNWHQLTDYQKTMFIVEAQEEIEREECIPLKKKYICPDACVAVNVFVSEMKKRDPEALFPMIKVVHDIVEEVSKESDDKNEK